MDVRFWRQSSRLPLKYIRHLGGQSKHIERTSGCTRNAPRCGRFGSHGRRNPAQSPARTLSGREMTCWPVSPRAGDVKNNHPSLIEPIAGAGWARRIGWLMEAMSWHRWLATLLVMRALAACAKGARPRLHTRHTRWRMCTTGAVTAPGQTVACSGQGQSDPAGPALNPQHPRYHLRDGDPDYARGSVVHRVLALLPVT